MLQNLPDLRDAFSWHVLPLEQKACFTALLSQILVPVGYLVLEVLKGWFDFSAEAGNGEVENI